MANRFKTIEELKTQRGVRYIKNVIYPEVPVSEEDTYIITDNADRYDTLAQQFYGDSSYWWVIATANVSKTDGLAVTPGIQLRIPHNPQSVKNLFEELNARR